MVNTVTASKTYLPREEEGARRTPAEVLALLCDAGDTIRGLRRSIVDDQVSAQLILATAALERALQLHRRYVPPPALYVADSEADRVALTTRRGREVRRKAGAGTQRGRRRAYYGRRSVAYHHRKGTP